MKHRTMVGPLQQASQQILQRDTAWKCNELLDKARRVCAPADRVTVDLLVGCVDLLVWPYVAWACSDREQRVFRHPSREILPI